MLSFDQLHTFRAIVKARSFTRAAEECYLTQPALSQRIKRLEEALGAELFDRSMRGRPPSLTLPGEIVLRYSEEAIGFEERLRDEIRQYTHQVRHTVSIACGASVLRYVIPTVLAAYARVNPSAHVQVVTAMGPEMMEMVRQGAVNLSLVPESELPDGRLTMEPLFQSRLFLVRSSGYDWPATAEMTRAGFPHGRRFVTGPPGSFLRRSASAVVASLDVPFDIAVECSGSDAVKGFVSRGFGIAFLPEYTVRAELQNGSLVEIPMPEPHPYLRIALLSDSRRKLPLAASEFVELLRQLDWQYATTRDAYPD